jgi:hypothetical protein
MTGFQVLIQGSAIILAFSSGHMVRTTIQGVDAAASLREHILLGASPCQWSHPTPSCRVSLELRQHRRDPRTGRSLGWEWQEACPRDEQPLEAPRWYRGTVSCQWTGATQLTRLPPLMVLVKR